MHFTVSSIREKIIALLIYFRELTPLWLYSCIRQLAPSRQLEHQGVILPTLLRFWKCILLYLQLEKNHCHTHIFSWIGTIMVVFLHTTVGTQPPVGASGGDLPTLLRFWKCILLYLQLEKKSLPYSYIFVNWRHYGCILAYDSWHPAASWSIRGWFYPPSLDFENAFYCIFN